MTKVALMLGETPNISKDVENVTLKLIFFSQILCQFQVLIRIPASFMAECRVWDVKACVNQKQDRKRPCSQSSLFRTNLSSYIRPIENSHYIIYDSFRIKLLHRL